MKALYQKNKIPLLVQRGLVLLGKLSIIHKEIWLKHFALGTREWKLKQLTKLMVSDYLRHYPSKNVKDVLVLGKQGERFLDSIHRSKTSICYLGQVDHDLVLTEFACELAKHFSVNKITTEAELKKQNLVRPFMYAKGNDQKYSDLIVHFDGQDKNTILAIEYERSLKNTERCMDLLKSYACMSNIDFIILIVEDETIFKRFLGLLSQRFLFQLHDKIGILKIYDVLENFLETPITTPKGKTNLEKQFGVHMKLLTLNAKNPVKLPVQISA